MAVHDLRKRFAPTAATPMEWRKPANPNPSTEVISYSFTVDGHTKTQQLSAGVHYTFKGGVPALTDDGIIRLQQSILMAASLAAGSDDSGLVPRAPVSSHAATPASAPTRSSSPALHGGRRRKGARRGSPVDVTGTALLTGKRPTWADRKSGKTKTGREFRLTAKGVTYEFTCWRHDSGQLQNGAEVRVTGTSGWRSDDGSMVSIKHPHWTLA